MSLSALFLFLIATGLAATPPVAPPCPQPDPAALATFEQHLEALRSENWITAARLMDPESLAVLKADFLDGLAELTPSERSEVLAELFNKKSLEEVQRLPPYIWYAYMLLAKSRSSGVSKDDIRDLRVEVLGAVAEPPDQLHVVYRQFTMLEELQDVTVATSSLRKVAGTWYMLTPKSVTGIGRLLRKQPPTPTPAV
ncbi:MAG: hypothetical protein AB2L07_21975 [Thermoanaerobaculaceae bacterium]